MHAALLIVLEVLPGGGLGQHGNSWQGYVLIELSPFLLVFGIVWALRSLLSLQAVAAPVVVALSVPLFYWAGLLIAVSVAVTLGFATP